MPATVTCRIRILPLDPFGARMGVGVPAVAPSPGRPPRSPAVLVAPGVPASWPAVCSAHSRVDLEPDLPTTSMTVNLSKIGKFLTLLRRIKTTKVCVMKYSDCCYEVESLL